MVAPPPSPLPALLAGGVERVAVRLDAEDDELLAAGRLPLLQQRPARQVGGHPHGVLRAPAAAARRARRRLAPRRHAVPHQLARPEKAEKMQIYSISYLARPKRGSWKFWIWNLPSTIL